MALSGFLFLFRNPGFKPGPQQGKKRFTQGFQINKIKDVSVTVPAEKKTHTNQNRTNQVKDARDRLLAKNKPMDAREKLNKKTQNADARQKLVTIRAQKEPLDARAKIQARKQQALGQTQGAGDFTLTRTVRLCFTLCGDFNYFQMNIFLFCYLLFHSLICVTKFETL